MLFTAWILNATSETLLDVRLEMQSFTNSRFERLQYETQPEEKLMTSRVLGPRRSLQYSFTYQLTSRDVAESVLLSSALGVELRSKTLGRLYSECDAVVAT